MARGREGEVRNLVLGKYELGRMLGQGSFAKVYYGRDLRDGQSVAIKIMLTPWFKRGFVPPVPSSPVTPRKWDDDNAAALIDGSEDSSGNISPRTCNAFQLISSMSSGFDLSGLFESEQKAATVFTSRAPAATVFHKLESAGKALRYNTTRGKGWRIRMEAKADGANGRLAVTAEVFEVAADVTVVEFAHDGGDALDFNKFCAEDVRPGLADIVWAWQGDVPALPGAVA
ncbi:unnamed protein product [Triticum turgidum subsp. durum]|uniref:non-specific serine/threonine protein kinase n=1 Tax=Triticum turgidum subsp. durum TaxID=4567 RepID=A0A9R1AM01_TRITD|nr:unnamed protein product [Triticum turgidum subsp. durum]